MNMSSLALKLFAALVGVTLLMSPLVTARGAVWFLAATVAVGMYWGFASRVVYGSGITLFCFEAFYGFGSGILVISYFLTLCLWLGLQQFLTMVSWSEQEGWSLGDALRSFVFSGIFFGVALFMSVLVGDLLYGSGAILTRMQSLLDVELLGTSLGVCAGTLIVLRRMTIPFRREILFGL